MEELILLEMCEKTWWSAWSHCEL